eukprot:TRINITY_DN902_c0_g1_i1.p1 TRINITY_DN902_c0_g1~~TRINITY_DN902_c0_g1_i1.p1  ORF type:complete len:402 (+),score=141.62 TRINITY_DN902_c0_g1_i1:117-1322(+)
MASKDKEMEDVEGDEAGVESSLVVTKYKDASDIANQALAAVIKEVAPGKKIVDLCQIGDKFINDKLATIWNKEKKMEKGVAFPTSISVNHTAGHFSPLLDDQTVLQDGDVAKIDLGVHIDGYISVTAHTVVVSEQSTATSPQPVTGRKADVICAAHYAAEAAHRLIKPGKKNTDVTEAIRKIAAEFKVEPVEGVLSHQMKRFIMDGNQTIIGKATQDQKVEEFEFEENQVYNVDIVMSTGDGKTRELDVRPTIYKRAVDQQYQLKMAASRYVLNEINSRFATMPFAIRALDEKRGKLGITELAKHDLVYPLPVLFEKPGEFVAQFKFTVIILSTGTLRLNSQPLPFVSSEYKVTDPDTLAILAQGTKRSKNNKKNKKKKKAKNEGEATGEKKSEAAMDTSK